MSSSNYETLRQMSVAYEYYADAYVGKDCPFPDRKPSPDRLCGLLQDMCLAAHKVLSEHKAMADAIQAMRSVCTSEWETKADFINRMRCILDDHSAPNA